MPSAGSAPAALATPAAKRYETLGNIGLALGAGEVMNCVRQILAPIFTRTILGWQRSFMPKMPGAPPMDDIMDAAQRFGVKIAVWEAARAVPFLVATIFLIRITLRLRKGEAEALFAARRWAFAALGVVALSALIQVLGTVPETIAYQKEIMGMMPGMPSGAAAPFDVGAFMSSFTIVVTVLGLIFGVIFFSIWPITLFVWSGKLIRETLPPQDVTSSLE